MAYDSFKKLHITLNEDEYEKLRDVLPERGAFQHLARRFIRALLENPTADSVTIKLKIMQ